MAMVMKNNFFGEINDNNYACFCTEYILNSWFLKIYFKICFMNLSKIIKLSFIV